MPQRPDTITSTRHPPAPSDNPGNTPGLLEEARMLGCELRSAAHSQVRLAALETRQAGESLVIIVAMGVIAGAVVFSAWLALVGAVMMALVERGLVTTSIASLLAMSIHGLLAVILIAAIRWKSRRLLLSATVNSLAPPPLKKSNPGTPA